MALGRPTVVLVGTLDTKGPEHAFVRDRLLEAGVAVTVIDVGVLGEPAFPPDIPADAVARAAGVEIADLRFSREGSDTRAVALDAMARGATRIVAELRRDGRCAGVMGMGGSGGSTVVSAVLRSLPVGVSASSPFVYFFSRRDGFGWNELTTVCNSYFCIPL
jgi:uncharacterized protein (UPF0261 family)